MERIIYHLKIWFLMSKNSFLVWLSNKFLFLMFLTGKLLRFFFFIAFIYFLVAQANSIAGYNTSEAIFFFLTFNLIDVVAQFLFREVYRFRPQLISGSFDLVLVKPTNVLFRILLGGSDLIDLITIPPLILAIVYLGRTLDPSLGEVLLYLLLIANGLLIATSFHIAVLAMGILTMEIDHTVMIYRDVTNLGRFPVDIYREPLRGILTYLLPVGVMITLPAKAFLGIISVQGVVLSLMVGLVSFWLSTRFWKKAIKYYTGASS